MKQIMNRVLGKLAVEEIRDSIKRCANSSQISHEAERLAKHFGVSKSRIYEITIDIRPKRKSRADKGKRTADLMNHEGLKFAASLVVGHNIDPAEALRTAVERGYEIPIELPTFQRYLNEKGLNRKNRRTNRTNYRRFEAAAPGDVFQFDMSGIKERFFDLKTRKLVKVSVLDVSKNHPNENKNLVKVWRFVLTDDHSRRRFIRFVAVDKANSSHVVAFLMEAYQEMGVPKMLYTDNDAIIIGGRNKRASQILDKALADSGGYKLDQHKAGNSRATGKVEVAHQWVEKLEKLLGLFIEEGRALTMDVLNRFAVQICNEYNNRVHRTTGETPMARWNAQRHLIRTVDAKVLKSAFLVDEFSVTINGDLTFNHKGVCYQLPTDQMLENIVARQSRSNRVTIIFPDELDFYTLVDFDGNEYDIEKVIAAPDTFGEFKSTPDDIAEITRKELKKFAKENAKAEKEANRQGYQPKPIPIIDTVYEEPKTNVTAFPKPTVDVTQKVLEELPTVQQSYSASAYAGQLISFWDAVKKFGDQFAGKAECKNFLLDGIFQDKDDEQPETQVREAVENFVSPAKSRLRLAN